ncbi:hypothetical protein SASPL_154585 [Salvia splendens]|uniref:RRM domain-containing protein n=1 Tax=Salvia splendens TaxID=180675 RepID=A0A8X8YYL1_SALSN|nr:hypothetical protein SASPL_154585 [Salvia splendens]
MAKDDADHTSTLSSIALLQERFRQLQRMKELRQERELMRTLSECNTSSPVVPVAAQPRCQLALSLWPDSQMEARAETWTPLKRYHSPPRPRGFGFITYDSEEAVDKVVFKNIHELNGKMVEVKRAVPKELSPGPTRSPSPGYNYGLNRANSFLDAIAKE